jgi:VWA domain-containing protein
MPSNNASPKPGPDEPSAQPRKARGSDWLSNVVGWPLSLLLHLLLLLGLTGVTWLSGTGVGGDGGHEVRLAPAVNPESIEEGEAAIAEIQMASPTLTVVQTTKTQRVEPISALNIPSRAPTEIDELIGIDGAAPGGGQVKEDWAGAPVGGGGGGSASFFGLAARGRRFVFVVDRSASMAGDPLQAAKDELLQSVNSLRRSMRFYIIFYDHGFMPMPGKTLVRATSRNKRDCFDWVRQVTSGGGTEPIDAMRLALSLGPDAIWLLSDGQFMSEDLVCREIQAANPGRRVQVHTIAFHDRAGEPVLKRIAEQNRGKYRFVP